MWSCALRDDALTIFTLISAVERQRDVESLRSYLNLVDSRGRTALAIASSLGRIHSVRVLLEEGASPLSTDSGGNTALHTAAFHGHHEIISTILQARVRGGDGTATSASNAIVRDIFGEERYIDLHNKAGYCPLHAAVANGHLQAAEVLIQAGACLDSPVLRGSDRYPFFYGGSTVLHIAAGMGNANMCILLLRGQSRYHGLDLRRSRNVLGLTPLNCALLGGHRMVCAALALRLSGESRDWRRPPRDNDNDGARREDVAVASQVLKNQLREIIHTAVLVLQLKDIARLWKAQGLEQEGDMQAVTSGNVVQLDRRGIQKLESILSKESCTLGDMQKAFEDVQRDVEVVHAVVASGFENRRRTRRAHCLEQRHPESCYDDLECSICMDATSEIKVDPCGHSLCFACACRLCGPSTRGVNCPFCRRDVAEFAMIPGSRSPHTIVT